jgi:hypothetical protein
MRRRAQRRVHHTNQGGGPRGANRVPAVDAPTTACNERHCTNIQATIRLVAARAQVYNSGEARVDCREQYSKLPLRGAPVRARARTYQINITVRWRRLGLDRESASQSSQSVSRSAQSAERLR